MRGRTPATIALAVPPDWRTGNDGSDIIEIRCLIEVTIASLKKLAETNSLALSGLFEYCHNNTPIPPYTIEYLKGSGLYNEKGNSVDRHVILAVRNFVEQTTDYPMFIVTPLPE